MTVTYHDSPVSVWQISREDNQPDWVKKAVAENKLVWLDNRLQILMAGLEPPIPGHHKLDTNGIFVGGGIDAHGVYAYGEIGDYLDATNQRVVFAKGFAKHYTTTN